MESTRRDFLAAASGAALSAAGLGAAGLAGLGAAREANAMDGPGQTVRPPLTSANLAPWARDFIEGIYTGPDGRIEDGCGCIVEGDSITSEVNSTVQSRYFMGMRETWRPLAWTGWSSTLGSDALIIPYFAVNNAFRSVSLWGHQRDVRRWYNGAAPSPGPSWWYQWNANEPGGNSIIRFDAQADRVNAFPSGLGWLRGPCRWEFTYLATPSSLRDMFIVLYRNNGGFLTEVRRIQVGVDFTAATPQLRTLSVDMPAGDGDAVFWIYVGNAQTQGKELITSSIRLVRNDGVTRGTSIAWTGVGGTKTRDLIDPTYQNPTRLAEYCASHSRVHLWLVQIGTNDNGSEWAAFPQNLNLFLQQRRAVAAQYARRARFLFVVPYLTPFDEPSKQLFMRQTLEAKARTDREVGFLDLSSMAPIGPVAASYFLADGVHPNPAGARAYPMAIWSALKNAYDAVYQGGEAMPVERQLPRPLWR